jgi:hypothetical protein
VRWQRRSPATRSAAQDDVGHLSLLGAIVPWVTRLDDGTLRAFDAWNFFEQDPKRIASITTRTWATVNN